MASLKELKIQQAKKDYEAAKKKGDKAGMVRAHAEADRARGQYTKTVVVDGQYQQQAIGNMGQKAASGELIEATRKLNQPAPVVKPKTPTATRVRSGLASANTPKKKSNVLEQAFDKEENYIDKAKRGDIAGAAANFVGTGLTGAQTLYLNAANTIDSLAQGRGLPKFRQQMDFADYDKAVAERRGAKPTIDKVSEINPVLGGAYRLIGEIGTDPLELLPGGMVNDIKLAKGTAQGSAAYADALKVGKMSPAGQKLAQASGRTTRHSDIYNKEFTPISKDAELQNIAQQIADMPNPNYAPGLFSAGLQRKLQGFGDKMDSISKMSDSEWHDYAKANGLGTYSGRVAKVENLPPVTAPKSTATPPQVTPQPQKSDFGADVRQATGNRPQNANLSDIASRKKAQAQNVALNRASDDAVITAKPGRQSSSDTGRQSTDNVPPINRSGVKPGYEVRGFSENIATDANMDEKIRQMYAEDPDIYEIAKNKDTLKRATDEFATAGTRDSYDNVMKAIASNTLKPEHVPLARMIANDLIKSGDTQGARNILSEISAKLTESGQFSQAANILRNSDPMAVLQFIQKTIDKTNTALKRKFKNFEGLKLTDEEIQKLGNIDMGDTDAISQAVEEIGTRLAKEFPSGWFEKFDELRRIAMLGNFKTQARNVVGNLPLMLERKLANKTSAVLQMKLPKEDRTQALLTTKESRNIAKQLYANDKDWLLDSNKWDNNEFRKVLNSERRVFGQSVLGRIAQAKNAGEKVQNVADLMGLEGIRKLVYGALQLGDSPFLKSAYVDRMASYISAQGYKTIDDVPQKAIDTAREEALKATFRDANSAAQFINNIKRKGGLKGKFVEATVPFVTTPANLVSRAIDYSPAGFIRSLAKIKNAEDVPKVIDEMAQGLTGTALIGIGAFFASNGIFVGAEDQSKKKANYEKTTGKIPFSIQTPFGSITYDWAQPFGSQLAIATEAYKAYNKAMQEKGEFTFQDLANAILQSGYAGIDVILQSSVYQNVLDLFNGFGSAGERITQNITEYPLQVIPTLAGQGARSADPYVRSQFDKTSKLATMRNSVMAKIPGQSDNLPIRYDTWGRPAMRSQNTGLRTLQEFLNPANVAARNETPLDKEILSLYDKTGSNDVFPRTAPYSFKDIDGNPYDLNNADVSEFQRVMGQYSQQEVQKLIASEEYRTMSDDDKVKSLNSIYSDAAKQAKMNYLKSKGKSPLLMFSEKQRETFGQISALGVKEEQFIETTNAVKGIKGIPDPNDPEKTIRLSESYLKKKAIDKANPGASPAELMALYHAFDVSKKVWNFN